MLAPTGISLTCSSALTRAGENPPGTELNIEFQYSLRHPGSLGCLTAKAWEAVIEVLSIWQNVMTYFEQLERHLLDEILVFANLIQIPAVILTGGVAWLVCRPI